MKVKETTALQPPTMPCRDNFTDVVEGNVRRRRRRRRRRRHRRHCTSQLSASTAANKLQVLQWVTRRACIL